MAVSNGGVHVGTSHVLCPVENCEEKIPVTVTMSIEADMLIATPDTTDIWAHAWTHQKETE